MPDQSDLIKMCGCPWIRVERKLIDSIHPLFITTMWLARILRKWTTWIEYADRQGHLKELVKIHYRGECYYIRLDYNERIEDSIENYVLSIDHVDDQIQHFTLFIQQYKALGGTKSQFAVRTQTNTIHLFYNTIVQPNIVCPESAEADAIQKDKLRVGNIFKISIYASVYMAFCDDYPAMVVKQICDSDAVEGILLEAKILRHLNNTPGVLEFMHMIINEHSQAIGFATKYIKGINLQDAMNDHSTFDKDKVIVRMVEIVIDIHKRNVVHGDIKLDNFMLTPDDDAVLVDFGVSSFINGEKSPNILSNRAYAAPELGDDFETTIQSDIYSLALAIKQIKNTPNLAPYLSATPEDRPDLSELLHAIRGI